MTAEFIVEDQHVTFLPFEESEIVPISSVNADDVPEGKRTALHAKVQRCSPDKAQATKNHEGECANDDAKRNPDVDHFACA